MTPEKKSCPVDHSGFIHKVSNSTRSECPNDSKVNPLNMMPELGQEMAPGQKIALSQERTISSIPKQDGHSKWEYPSPQQFYNALKRKGWETPEHQVSTMVDIHNFLNEGCWQEVLRWEQEYHCDCKNVKLVKFMGRPSELTPKARIYSWFGVEKPFDRHDWTIDRCGEQVRYVIDYYSAPDEAPGVPVFYADVRPALDSPSAIFDRTRRAFTDIWNQCFQKE